MTNQRENCRCKVGRVTAEYGLSTGKTRLVERWQDEKSIRQLTDELNEAIIESELNTAALGQVGWNLSSLYEALHAAETSEAEAIEIRRELDRAGVDIEKVSSDLVSHQTVYRHLTNCLDASKNDDRTPQERREKAKDTVHALQRRTEIVTESTIETLQAADVVDVGDMEVLVNLQVVCNDCGRSMDFESAIGEGCDCDAT